MPEDDEVPPERVLMCAADWKDPDCRKVISEFHKDGLDSEILDVDQDLQGFEKVWGDKGPAKFQSEYHKEGAPYLDKDGLNDYVPEGPVVPTGRSPKDALLDRKLDVGTVEVITYALFRAIFGYGVNIPIKRPGMVDMDVTIKGKDININTNDFYFNVPDRGHRAASLASFSRAASSAAAFRAARRALVACLDLERSFRNSLSACRRCTLNPLSTPRPSSMIGVPWWEYTTLQTTRSGTLK